MLHQITEPNAADILNTHADRIANQANQCLSISARAAAIQPDLDPARFYRPHQPPSRYHKPDNAWTHLLNLAIQWPGTETTVAALTAIAVQTASSDGSHTPESAAVFQAALDHLLTNISNLPVPEREQYTTLAYGLSRVGTHQFDAKHVRPILKHALRELRETVERNVASFRHTNRITRPHIDAFGRTREATENFAALEMANAVLALAISTGAVKDTAPNARAIRNITEQHGPDWARHNAVAANFDSLPIWTRYALAAEHTLTKAQTDGIVQTLDNIASYYPQANPTKNKHATVTGYSPLAKNLDNYTFTQDSCPTFVENFINQLRRNVSRYKQRNLEPDGQHQSVLEAQGYLLALSRLAKLPNLLELDHTRSALVVNIAANAAAILNDAAQFLLSTTTASRINPLNPTTSEETNPQNHYAGISKTAIPYSHQLLIDLIAINQAIPEDAFDPGAKPAIVEYLQAQATLIQAMSSTLKRAIK